MGGGLGGPRGLQGVCERGNTCDNVGITGAGLAGLSAEVLVEEGIKVTIIEARDRLGGRVSSFRS